MVLSKVLPFVAILILYMLVDIAQSLAEDWSYFFYRQPELPRDCQEILEQCPTRTASGVYLIKPDGFEEAFEVFCDNNIKDGGWTVFQRRNGGNSIAFGRNFSDYRDGFGFLNGEFWLGNERLSFLTNQKPYRLRIDMTNSAGSSFYVEYDLFRISDEWSDYRLTSVGDYNGTTNAFIRQCPPNTIFGPCACQGSCTDPNGCLENCTVEESCFCPSPYLLLGSDCVPQERCSCFIQEVGVISENGSYFSSDCSEHCTCEKGTLMCHRDLQCDTNAVCEKRNNVRKCYCNQGYAGDGQTCTRTASPILPDCYDFFTSGFPDGVYTISPTGWTGLPFEVYCNMSHGGGWTVMQRRVNRSVSFTRNWDAYKDGFGIPNHELWLGNEKLYHMTNQQTFELRIDVIKEEDNAHWNMNYDLFRVDNMNNNYQLELGTYFGNAGFDYMTRHRNRQFSTPDRDNDDTSYRHCAALSNSGWWFGGYCWTADFNQMVNGFDYMTRHRNRQFSTPDRDNDDTSYYHCAAIVRSGWWFGGNCWTANLNGMKDNLIQLHDLVNFNYVTLRYTQMKIRPV